MLPKFIEIEQNETKGLINLTHIVSIGVDSPSYDGDTWDVELETTDGTNTITCASEQEAKELYNQIKTKLNIYN